MRLSEGLLEEQSSPDLAARVIALVQSRSEPAVRLQLARMLGEINSPAADVALREIIEEKIGWDLPEPAELTRPVAKKRKKH